MEYNNFELMKRFNLKWDERYSKRIDVHKITEIHNYFLEPLKVRGKELEKLIEERPQTHYEDGTKTGKLLYSSENNCDKGNTTGSGVDSKGFYMFFEPKKDEIDKIELDKKVEDKYDKILSISKKQYGLTLKTRSLQEFQQLKKEIDNLYIDVFELEENSKSKLILKFPKYCKVTSLIVKGDVCRTISEEIRGEFLYYYKDKIFNTCRQLSKHISEVKGFDFSIKQYVNDSLSATGSKQLKGTILKTTLDYCDYHKIEVLSKFRDLLNEKQS